MNLEKHIKIENYMSTSSGNYGTNSLKVQIGDLFLWFSYQTVVAFRDYSRGGELFLSENIYSKTTGKHLNEIGRYYERTIERLPREVFEQKLSKTLVLHGLVPTATEEVLNV